MGSDPRGHVGATRDAFIVMPIGAEGTADHAHFKALYESFIKVRLEQAGYKVQRADDSALSGAINKHIVTRLAGADLVVADLTMLNPNVFYEVGVRHALRRNGTILILDESRTEQIPFDLSGYRAILFRSDVSGVAKLEQQMKAALAAVDHADADHRDNPVHDWLTMLPENAIAKSSQSEIGKLRSRLAESERKVSAYERRLGERYEGSVGGIQEASDIAVGTVDEALDDARDGNLTPDLLQQAERAADARNSEEYLSITRRLLDREGELESRNYLTLGRLGQQLGLRQVVRAIYDLAAASYPDNDVVRKRRLRNLTHSPDRAARSVAREEIAAMIGIHVNDENVTVPDHISTEDAASVAVMLDAYHADSLHDDARRITEQLVERFPDMTTIARNHARALKRAKRPEAEWMTWYVRAVKCPDVTSMTTRFLGATLHDAGRRVDALESYSLGCVLSPSDSTPFADVASEGAWAIRGRLVGDDKSERTLPNEFDSDTIKTAIVAARSCDSYTQDDHNSCIDAARNAEIDSQWTDQMLTSPLPASERMTLEARFEFANRLRELLRSDLTS